MGELRNVVRTVGILDYNEKNIFWVNTKFDGWIEKVYLNYVGEKVRKGQRLFEIYSPELVSTQEEYLTAMNYLEKMKEAGSREAVRQAEALMAATRKRLAYWDVTEDQIKRLERTGEVSENTDRGIPGEGPAGREDGRGPRRDVCKGGNEPVQDSGSLHGVGSCRCL